METERYSQKIREENEMRTQRFHSQLRWCLGIVMSASLCGWASIGPITYLTSLSENGSGVATNAIRRETNSKYKMPVDLSPTFMPSCGDLSQIAELDPTYNSRAFFSNCEIYPLKNPTGKELTVLFVDRKGLNRNIDNNGKFIIGTAEVQVEGGIIDMFNKTNVRIIDMRWVQINRLEDTKHRFIVGDDQFVVGIDWFGKINISSAEERNISNRSIEPMIFQISNASNETDKISLSEKLRPITESPLLTVAGALLLVRFLGGLTGRGVRKIVVLKGPNGEDQRYREPPIYGLKGLLIRAFRVPGYISIQNSFVSGGPEPEKTAAQMRTPASIFKTMAAFILGR